MNFLEQHPVINEHRRNDPALNRYWIKLADILNSVPQGAVKHVAEWKQVSNTNANASNRSNTLCCSSIPLALFAKLFSIGRKKENKLVFLCKVGRLFVCRFNGCRTEAGR